MQDHDIDPGRRALVLAALASGLFDLGANAVLAAASSRSVHRLRGELRVNGAPADASAVIAAGDLVETGADSEVVFAVADDAFILRAQSRLQLAAAPTDGAVVEGLRVFTGALLSVFGKRSHRLDTPIATIGIRGTGVYVEAEPEQDYVCTCYGVTEIAAHGDPASRAVVESGHHEARYIVKGGVSGERVRRAPFKNHTDDELTLIESLVGRLPEFSGDYERPRRRNY
jgi:hypothetical protein